VIETESNGHMAADAALAGRSNQLFVDPCRHRHSCHFDSMGRPIA